MRSNIFIKHYIPIRIKYRIQRPNDETAPCNPWAPAFAGMTHEDWKEVQAHMKSTFPPEVTRDVFYVFNTNSLHNALSRHDVH